MTQPLAFLNDEEMHWLNDLGLPNQRRWLNHRTLGDEHRRTFPSAATHTNIFCEFCASRLTEGEFAGAALLVFEAGSHFQEPIEHLRAFRAAGCKLRVSLFVHVLQAVKFVCDVQRREDRHFQ